MVILTILGFVLFAVLSVFGTINVLMQLKKLDVDHKALVDKLQHEKEKEAVERLQFLAGIKTKTEVPQVPVKLGSDIVGELLAESEVDLLKEIEQDKEKLKKVFHPAVSKQYTRR
jgi:hypothetical protein